MSRFNLPDSSVFRHKSCRSPINTDVTSYQISSIISLSARQIKLSYDSSWRVTAVINPAGVTIEGYTVEIPLLWIKRGWVND